MSNTEMFGVVTIPYRIDDELKRAAIDFIDFMHTNADEEGVDLWAMVEEHDRVHGTDWFDVLTVDNVIADEIEYDVSLYRVTWHVFGEYEDEYFMTEEEAFMHMLHEWQDSGHHTKSSYGRSWDVYGVEIDLNDESVIDGWYVEMYEVLWQENELGELATYFPARFNREIREDERLEERMRAYYNLDKNEYESVMDEWDDECVFTEYYERVKAWKEGA